MHRDVKPANVFLCTDGRVVLIDFGIARRATSETTEVQVVGTPGFVAPERLAGAPGSTAADVYGAARLLALLREDVAAPDAPTAPVLAAATADDPSARPADAAALHDALVRARTVGATTPITPTRVLAPRRDGTRRAAALVAILAALTVGAVAVAHQHDAATRPPTSTTAPRPRPTSTVAPPTTVSTTTAPVRAVSTSAPTAPPPHAKHDKHERHRHH